MKAICDNIRLRTGGTEPLTLDDIAEAVMNIGWETDLVTQAYHAIGTTYPPEQLPAEAKFDGYDIDINTSSSDDLYAYIDAKVSGKDTVTKEIMGKDESEAFDVVRYTYAKREQLAWQRENHPKMYAWKNGNTIKYTESVSPRIDDKAFDVPYLQTTTVDEETVPAFTNLKDQCTFKYGQRYSLSGQAFKTITGSSLGSGVILPVPSEETSVTVRIKGVTFNTNYIDWYGGTSAAVFSETITRSNTDDYGILSPDENGVYTTTITKSAGITHIIFVTGDNSTTADSFADFIITINEPIEYTTSGDIEIEGGTPVTDVNATNRSRIIGGVEYVRYESGDVEPTLIYTDKDDERNNLATITKDGVTYKRYPLGDLGSNRKTLIPVFIYANEHGDMAKADKSLYHETKMCSVVAGRFLCDLASDKQSENPLYKFIRENCMLIVIPVVNPFGYNIRLTGGSGINTDNGYLNAKRCNINRNYDTPGWDVNYQKEVVEEGNPPAWVGTYAGSQNETQYVMNTMVESKAVVAMSIHGVGSWEGYCAHQGQSPDGSDYNRNKLEKINTFLQENWGYKLRYYDLNSDGTPAVAVNTPDITSKSPSYITQCGAYGGIVELQGDDVNTSGYLLELKSNVIENAYAQVLNLLAMWLSDYLENTES